MQRAVPRARSPTRYGTGRMRSAAARARRPLVADEVSGAERAACRTVDPGPPLTGDRHRGQHPTGTHLRCRRHRFPRLRRLELQRLLVVMRRASTPLHRCAPRPFVRVLAPRYCRSHSSHSPPGRRRHRCRSSGRRLARVDEAGTKMSTFAHRGHRGAPSHALGTNRHQ
eukprot:COSAG06_NODE_4365_length_4328_cov_12.154410_4_plen_168_part_01